MHLLCLHIYSPLVTRHHTTWKGDSRPHAAEASSRSALAVKVRTSQMSQERIWEDLSKRDNVFASNQGCQQASKPRGQSSKLNTAQHFLNWLSSLVQGVFPSVELGAMTLLARQANFQNYQVFNPWPEHKCCGQAKALKTYPSCRSWLSCCCCCCQISCILDSLPTALLLYMCQGRVTQHTALGGQAWLQRQRRAPPSVQFCTDERPGRQAYHTCTTAQTVELSAAAAAESEKQHLGRQRVLRDCPGSQLHCMAGVHDDADPRQCEEVEFRQMSLLHCDVAATLQCSKPSCLKSCSLHCLALASSITDARIAKNTTTCLLASIRKACLHNHIRQSYVAPQCNVSGTSIYV